MFKIRKIIQGDKIIWIILFFLALISILEVYSSIGKFAFEKAGGRTTSLILKHTIIILAGFGVIFFVSNIKYTRFASLSRIGYYFCIPLLLGTFILGIFSSKAAGRWVDGIPIIGQFQPSEIAKVVLILYVARLLTLKQDSIKEYGTFRSLLIPIFLIAGLIFPENFSTAAILFLVCFLMIFIGGVRLKYWISMVGMGFGALIIAFLFVFPNVDIFRSGTWDNRIEEYLAEDKNAITQVNTAKVAIASGGIIGKMPGGTIQGRLLSESHNDFIYAIIIEELGLIGGVVILLMYLWLFYRCMQISFKAEGLFASYTSAGLGLLILIQALVNMGVAVNLLPVTGQTLPFVSYGGTSFIFSCISIGIILSISADVQKKENNEEIDVESEAIDITNEESIPESV